MKPRRIAVSALFLVLLIPAVVPAQSVRVPFRWTAPRSGSAADHYNVYQVQDGGSPHLVGVAADTLYVLSATRGVRHQIQVSGVSADGREGPVSALSDAVFYEIPQTGEEIPGAPALRANYPNPFNPQTTVVYGVPEGIPTGGPLSLDIYDLRGQRVRSLPVEESPGWHEALWNGVDESGQLRGSGQYFVRFRCGEAVKTWKMTMLK